MQLRDQALTFLHISDLHLRAYENVSGGPTRSDLDHDLRAQLLQDAGRLAQRFGKVDGILVSGDVAYSGKAEEYAVATEYLSRMCAQLGCEDSDVWVIPGNHDVVRGTVDKSPVLKTLHHDLRTKPTHQLSNQIQDLLADTEVATV